MADYPLDSYYAGVSAALRAHDIEAIPGLLKLMVLDGYGDAAEELRRYLMLCTDIAKSTERVEAGQ